MWFRIELHRDGSVASCKEVEGSFSGEGKTVHYVEADNQIEAIKLLAVRYDRMRAQSVASNMKTRAKRDAVGLCGCGAARDVPGCKGCSACIERAKYYRQKRKQNKNTGGKTCKTLEEKALGFHMRSKSNRKAAGVIEKRYGGSGKYQRFRFLSGVAAKFDSMTPRAFRAWLAAELDALTPRNEVAA